MDGEVVPRSATGIGPGFEMASASKSWGRSRVASIEPTPADGTLVVRPRRSGGREWGSRLIVGTGGFRSLEQMEAALRASGTEIVTVALRRVDPAAQGSLVDLISEPRSLLPAEHGRLLHGP